MKSSALQSALTIGLLFVIGLTGLWLLSGGGGGGAVAPKPAAFTADLTLEQAMQQSDESGRPVLVFATADWCRPCQQMKRTTLSDDEVTAAILSGTEPVYLDLTDASASSEAGQAASAMGVQGLPAMMVVRDGRVVARLAGMHEPWVVLSWLQEHGRE